MSESVPASHGFASGPPTHDAVGCGKFESVNARDPGVQVTSRGVV
ncbi:hypothetical protein I549_4824 [Mycobacterium avium subsp. avium 2285 (R)]|nr:hypothetical protein I549_4824 [Mycobacterium avium subsp. avium 2285 (R)]